MSFQMKIYSPGINIEKQCANNDIIIVKIINIWHYYHCAKFSHMIFQKNKLI